MCGAIGKIDAAFGQGYAHAHPELLAQFIVACSTWGVADALDDVARNIENYSSPEAPDFGDIARAIHSVAEMIDYNFRKD
jgi:hypothetical protein